MMAKKHTVPERSHLIRAMKHKCLSSSYSRLFRIQDHWISHFLCRNSAV